MFFRNFNKERYFKRFTRRFSAKRFNKFSEKLKKILRYFSKKSTLRSESELIKVDNREELDKILNKKAKDPAFQTKLIKFVPSIFVPLIKEFAPWLIENLIEEFDPLLTEKNLSERLPELTENLLKKERKDRTDKKTGVFINIEIDDAHFTILSNYQLLIFTLNFALKNKFFQKRFFQKIKECH